MKRDLLKLSDEEVEKLWHEAVEEGQSRPAEVYFDVMCDRLERKARRESKQAARSKETGGLLPG